MKKFYRLVAFFFIAAAAFFSAGLIIFQKDLRQFLSSINNIDSRSSLVIEHPKVDPITQGDNLIDISLLKDSRFAKLQKAVVDLTGFDLPVLATPTSTSRSTTTLGIGISPLATTTPEFKIGNNDPFKALTSK